MMTHVQPPLMRTTTSQSLLDLAISYQSYIYALIVPSNYLCDTQSLSSWQAL